MSGAPTFSSGTPPIYNSQLTVSSGTLNPSTNLTYDWYRSSTGVFNASDVRVATGTNTYTPTISDIDSYLVVLASSTDAIGTSSITTTSKVSPILISSPSISGITIPVIDGTPVSAIDANQYSATVTWSGTPTVFSPNTIYTATITITPKSGYTLTGVTANYFTVAGTSVPAANLVNSGVVTAIFPSTGALTCKNGFQAIDDVCIAVSSNSLPPEAYNSPIIPTGGFHFLINNGQKITKNKDVILTIQGGDDVESIAISNSANFETSYLEPYVTTKNWNLCSGANSSVSQSPCSEGNYSVYIKFFTKWGRSSDLVQANILLGNNEDVVINQAPVITETTDKTVIKSASPIKYQFKRNLKIGDVGDDVKNLQSFLNKNGFVVANTGPGSINQETNKFGPLTEKALSSFQEHYADKILKPLNLKSATGAFHSYTRSLVNNIINK